MNTRKMNQMVASVVERNTHYQNALNILATMAHPTQFTAEDVGIAGITLSCLAAYDVLDVVGEKSAFICIDGKDTYKKISVKIYKVANDCDIIELVKTFNEHKKEYQVNKIETRINLLKAQLKEALADLEKIEKNA